MSPSIFKLSTLARFGSIDMTSTPWIDEQNLTGFFTVQR